MTKKFNILFVDDDFNEESKSQVNRLKVIEPLTSTNELNVFPIHPNEFEEIANKAYFIKNSINIVILDYELSSHSLKKGGEKFKGNGRSVAARIREVSPTTPLYLVSRTIEENFNCSDVFEKVLTHRILTKAEGRKMLVSDAKDFQLIESKRENDKGLTSIIELLITPEDARESLKLSLPNEFHESLFKEQNKDILKIGFVKSIKFIRWVLGKLTEYSGPLCTDQEAAQILGLSKDYFQKTYLGANRTLKDCKYSGIFNSDKNRLWWRESLFNWVGEKLKNKNYNGELPWKVLPTLTGIHAENRSKCVICKKEMPDCLAYSQQIPEKKVRYMAHWMCSKIADDMHPDFGFNEIYYLIEDE